MRTPIVLIPLLTLAVAVVIVAATVSTHRPTNSSVAPLAPADITGVKVVPGRILYTLKNGATAPFMDVADVYSDHYHPAEFHNGNVYVIRRIGDTSSSTWTDELWKYDSAKRGSRIF